MFLKDTYSATLFKPAKKWLASCFTTEPSPSSSYHLNIRSINSPLNVSIIERPWNEWRGDIQQSQAGLSINPYLWFPESYIHRDQNKFSCSTKPSVSTQKIKWPHFWEKNQDTKLKAKFSLTSTRIFLWQSYHPITWFHPLFYSINIWRSLQLLFIEHFLYSRHCSRSICIYCLIQFP